MNFTGITEIYGSKGSGKTTYILNLLAPHRVAYFTTKKLQPSLLHNIFTQNNISLENLHINLVFDVYKLTYIYCNTITNFINDNKMHAIVIDTFDSLFTTIHDVDKKYELFTMLERVKEVCFRLKVNTYLIQEFPMRKDVFRSYVLKYDIKYMINKQISLSKDNEIYSLEEVDFLTGNKTKAKFKIVKNTLTFCDFNSIK